MTIRNKNQIITVIAAAAITLLVIYLHLLSHEETQKIYRAQTEHTIVTIKKDFLKDTVDNIFLEIDRIRLMRHRNYKRITDLRLIRLQEEIGRTDDDFIKFCRERFEDEANPGMWTVGFWDETTGKLLYSANIPEQGSIEPIRQLFKEDLSSYAEIGKGKVRGLFGISKTYVETEVKKDVADLIRGRKFSNDSYIWVNEIVNYEGGDNYAIRRVHPNLRDTEGTYLSTFMKDINGKLPYLEELEGVKKHGETFFTYSFKKLNSQEVSEKVTYAKLYRDYNWIIAMGVHLDEIDALAKKSIESSKASSSETIIRLLGYIIIILLIGYIGMYFLEKRRLRQSTKSLEKEFQTDIVTNAISRRFGEKLLAEQFNKDLTTGNATAVMMFDLDDFKNINDKYGHGVGDLVLRAIVSTLAQVTRSSDRIVRWGGDEFVIMLPGLRVENVKSFGEKALGAISSLRIPAGRDIVTISISGGISIFRENDSDYNDAVKRADDALYNSKKLGKNRVSILL